MWVGGGVGVGKRSGRRRAGRGINVSNLQTFKENVLWLDFDCTFLVNLVVECCVAPAQKSREIHLNYLCLF